MLVEEKLISIFCEKNLTIATAESCTGGLLSKRITDISGSSKIFGYGLCTYANEAKQKLLGVSADSLEKFGAVSKEVAFEMASGLLKLSGTDVVLCTTGIASATGAPTGKPVGLVYLAVGKKAEHSIDVYELNLESFKTRQKIRNATADIAFAKAIEYAECK